MGKMGKMGKVWWLRRSDKPEAGEVTLTSRRVFILPTRAGLSFVVLLAIMLIGSLNYNLGLGFARSLCRRQH